jgi:hypothetical protein
MKLSKNSAEKAEPHRINNSIEFSTLMPRPGWHLRFCGAKFDDL